MTVNYFIDLATSADIPAILALQEQNLPESGGGLSVRQTADWFKRTMAEMPLIVAWRGDQVVGYMVTTTLAAKAHVEIVQAMLRSFAAPPDCYSYGPVCVAESERRRGLADAMFVRLRSELPNRPAMTFVLSDNLPSLKAHHKMGMQRLSVFTYNGISYTAFRY